MNIIILYNLKNDYYYPVRFNKMIKDVLIYNYKNYMKMN